MKYRESGFQKMRQRCMVLAMLAIFMVARPSAAEPPPSFPSVLTLDWAVNYALAHQPTISAQRALEGQAFAAVEEARAAYLQEMEASESVNWAKAAHNPVGLYLPMPGFPVFEGSRTNGNFGHGAWNGATSIFLSEDVVALIRQMDLVDSALAKLSKQTAASDEQRLLVAFDAAQAFMNEVSAAQVVTAAQAGVIRAQAFATAVKGLETSGLRPGADLARAEAELALAQNQEISARRDLRIARAALAQTLGATDMPPVAIDEGPIYRFLPKSTLPQGPSSDDPILRQAAAEINSTRRLARAARLEYLPRLSVVGGVFGRGSGFGYGGSPAAAAGGTLPSSFNLTAGAVVTVPFERIFRAGAEIDRAKANIKFAQAQYQQALLQLRAQFDSADAIFKGARQVAGNTPVELDAARANQRQNVARYRAGLATALDVADANRLLTQAEVDDAVARVNVWRALLLAWRAAGDLGPFMAAVRNASEQRSR